VRNEEINVNKILAVINVAYAVAKRKPEKIRLAGIRTGIRITEVRVRIPASFFFFSGFLFATA